MTREARLDQHSRREARMTLALARKIISRHKALARPLTGGLGLAEPEPCTRCGQVHATREAARFLVQRALDYRGGAVAPTDESAVAFSPLAAIERAAWDRLRERPERERQPDQAQRIAGLAFRALSEATPPGYGGPLDFAADPFIDHGQIMVMFYRAQLILRREPERLKRYDKPARILARGDAAEAA